MSNGKTPRERAESHFSTIPPFSARDRAFDELDAIKAVRDEKTQRLREARLARHLQNAAKPPSPVPSEKKEPQPRPDPTSPGAKI